MIIVGPQPPSDHVSKYRHFFHLMVLYSIVEYLIFGTMEFEIQSWAPITRQVRCAAGMTDVRDRMIPMYSAVALLLIPANNQDDGTFTF
jgi:hypothetical protein